MHIQIGMTLLLTASLLLATACTPTTQPSGVDNPHKRHNEWARFGRPDVGGSRANDR